MMKHLMAGVLAGVLVASPAAIAQNAGADAPAQAPAAKKKTLGVGDPAPSLEGIKWLKGEPISGFQAGQVYVLDFWATWCGPCIRAIPHMNDLHAKLKDKGVNVVGLAIWPKPGMKPTKEFVEAKGDDMAYRIGEDVNDILSNSYMKPARQNGIPCVFIVDQKGKIAWIGHPQDGMDEVIDEVVAGKFDPAAHAKAMAEREQLEMALAEASQSENHAKGLELADKLLKMDAKRYQQLHVYKYVALSKSGKASEAKAVGSSVLGTFADDANMLNLLAWTIVDPDGEFVGDVKPDADLALAAATTASSLKGDKDPSILDTVARAYFVKGDLAKAVEVQTRAIDAAEGDLKEQLRPALDEYKAALEAKKGG